MINNLVSGFQLFMVMLSVSIIMYTILRGDDRKSSYYTLLLNLCMLWMVLI